MPEVILIPYEPSFWGERLRIQQENNPIDYGDMQPWDYDISQCAKHYFTMSNHYGMQGKKVHFCGNILCPNPFDLELRKRNFLKSHEHFGFSVRKDIIPNENSEYYFYEVGKNNFYEPEGVRKAYFDLDKKQGEYNKVRKQAFKDVLKVKLNPLREEIKGYKKECRNEKGIYCKNCPGKSTCEFDKILFEAYQELKTKHDSDDLYWYRLYAGKTKLWRVVKSIPLEFDGMRRETLYSFLDDYFDFSDVTDEDARTLLMVNEGDDTKRSRKRRVRSYGKEPEQPKLKFMPYGEKDGKHYAFEKHTEFVDKDDCEDIKIHIKYDVIDDPKLLYPMHDGINLSYQDFMGNVAKGEYTKEYSLFFCAK